MICKFHAASGSSMRKVCAAASLRLKVDRAIVKLNDTKRGGQADSASARPGGEKQLKNLLLILGRDALAGIGHTDFG
jgi:hypothetical protein